MTFWYKWLSHPQGVWARKALFQVHLWTGIALGSYILVMSLTGVALIYRREITRKFGTPTVAVSGARLSDDRLRALAIQAHPGYSVLRVILPGGRNPAIRPVEIWLADNGKVIQHNFNPYTGVDLGPATRVEMRALAWTAHLHSDLLLGLPKGWTYNGIGAILTTVMSLTGAVIWWPGIGRWRRSLSVDWRANAKRFNWTLHSALGLWSLLFVLMWGVSGIYMCFPAPFQTMADWLGSHSAQYGSMGAAALAWLASLHFGRFSGLTVELIWTVFGLAPVALFVTGAIMWWNRVLSPSIKRRAHKPRPAAIGTRGGGQTQTVSS